MIWAALIGWVIASLWYAMYNLGDKPYQSKYTAYIEVLFMLPVYVIIMLIGCFTRKKK